MTTFKSTVQYNAEEFREYRRAQSVALRNRLVEQYMPLVRKIASRLAKRVAGHGVDHDELFAYGQPALIWAVEHFDPDNATKATFVTFAMRRIYYEMIDVMRELDHVPRLTRARTKFLAAAADRFYVQHGKRPQRDELQRESGLTDEKFARYDKEQVLQLVSLSEEVRTGEHNGTPIMDLIPERSPTPLDAILDADTIIKGITLPFLGLRSALILKMRFKESLTLREISVAMRVSESAISQQLGETLRFLRGRLTNAEAA